VNGVSFAAILEMKESLGYGRFAAILDCCFAGLGSPDIRGSEDDQLKSYAQGRGVFFLGAANATEAAKEDESLGHGLLTAATIDGLQNGLADAAPIVLRWDHLLRWRSSSAAGPHTVAPPHGGGPPNLTASNNLGNLSEYQARNVIGLVRGDQVG